MLKARNRKLSMILVLAMLMTMFVGLGTASAVEYKGSIQPYLQQGETNLTPGQLIIKWDLLPPAAGNHVGIISLPSGLEFNASTPLNTELNATALAPIINSDTAGAAITANYELLSKKEAKLTIVSAGVYSNVTAFVPLAPVDVSSDAPIGEAYAEISHLSGLFAPGRAHIGNVSGGQVLVSIVDTVTFTDGTPTTVELTIKEDSQGGLKADTGTLKLKLPKGYTFDNSSADLINVNTGATSVDVSSAAGVKVNGTKVSSDGRTLTLDRDAVTVGKQILRLSFDVTVDALEAEVGDCVIDISGKSTVMPGSIKIGSFADYGYTIKVADEDKEIIAGRDNSDDSVLSKVTIKENLGGSLLNGRTIVMTLPDGVEWLANQNTATAIANAGEKTLNNTMNFGSIQTVANRPNVAKAVLTNGLPTSKGEMSFEPQVAVAANYEGPITIEFSGTAGINETITVGKAVKGLTATADKIDVKIGSQDQQGADIVIKEVKAGVLLATGGSVLTLTAPAGVGFSKLPVVKTEGDIKIGTVTRAPGIDGTRNNVLNIPINSATSKNAATITISNVYYTLDRTVPEGAMNITVAGNTINEAGITNKGTAAVVNAANCVTPAPGEKLGNGEFRIGSNIYSVGGVAKVMDAAPYIKDSRTYVPMRFLGEILGAEVVWDDAARTVTLTKGDDVAVFTIGSASYTVNGEAKTADVAPEIVNSRTMLPARFVAEAFGAVVGWDAGTQTVLIQN